MKTKNYKNILFYCSVFAGLLCVLFFTPYAADDYGEKISAINGTWAECFKMAICYGNGRFLGNLGLYAGLHNDIFRIIAKPLLTTVFLFCTYYIFDIKKTFERLIVALLLIVPSNNFFSACYSDSPSFFNYVAPVTFFLCAICIIKYCDLKKHNNIFLTLLLFIISISMQLFSENSSIIFLILASGLIVYYFVENKKIKLNHAVLLSGAVIGFAAMMLLPEYIKARFGVKYDMSDYRRIVLSIPYMLGVVSQFAEMFISAFAVVLVLSIAEIYIVSKECTDNKRKYYIAIPFGYSLLSFLYTVFQTNEKKILAPIKLFMLLALMVFLINSVLIVWRFIKEKKDRTIIYFLGFSAATAVGIFTVLSQHAYRTYYLPLCLIIGIALYLINIIRKEYGTDLINPKTESVLNKTLICVFICFAAITTLQMIQNYDVCCLREAYVSEKLEQGEDLIYIPKLPNNELYPESYMQNCKTYLKYDKKEDAEIVFVDLEEWEWLEEYYAILDNPVESVMFSIKNYNFNNKRQ